MRNWRQLLAKATAMVCPLPHTRHITIVFSVWAEFGVDVVEHGGSMTDETIQLLLG